MSCWSAIPSSTNTTMFQRSENPPRKTSSQPCPRAASSSPAACSPRPTTWRASASRSRSSPFSAATTIPKEFIDAHLRPNVKLTPIRVDGRPTTRKLRYVELGYLHKLFEVYTMNDTPFGEAERAEIDRVTKERVRGADVVVATDFGHGMIALEYDRHPDRKFEIPCRQCPEQRRQFRLQSGHALSARRLHLHRCAGSASRHRRQIQRYRHRHRKAACTARSTATTSSSRTARSAAIPSR